MLYSFFFKTTFPFASFDHVGALSPSSRLGCLLMSDTEFFSRLDAVLVPLTKLCQHAINFNYRTVNYSGSLDGQAPLSSVGRPLTSSCDVMENESEQELGAMGDTLRRIAREECEGDVDGVAQWLEKLRQGRQIGEQCLGILQDLTSCLGSMRDVTRTVQEQSNSLSSNAAELIVRKARLEMVREELERMIEHFYHIDSLEREVDQATISVTSYRYPNLLQEMEEEMQFLMRNPLLLSTRPYMEKLSSAQRRAHQQLKDAIIASFCAAQIATTSAPAYQSAFRRYMKWDKEWDGVRRPLMTEPVDSLASLGNAPEDDPGSDCVAAESGVPALPLCGGADEVSVLYQMITRVLVEINEVFCTKLRENCSLRRMLEAHAPGSGLLDEDGDDLGGVDTFDAYREARVTIIGPLLRRWLEELCVVDAKGSSGDAHGTSRFVGRLVGLMKLALDQEVAVFGTVWLREDLIARFLPQLVSDISGEVYHVFRSHLLQVDELEELARTIEEIQRASSRQHNIAEIGGLLTKMLQDTQERLLFRTNLFLRHSIANCSLNREVALQFLAEDGPADGACIDSLKNCITLLQLLYPSLEFSVFSVFAEEAINCTVLQVQELSKIIAQQPIRHGAIKGNLCQLLHLLYLYQELSLIDENIIVVKKGIGLRLAQRRLEIVQSSRESKKDVDGEIKLCYERLSLMIFAEVSLPLTGIARKKPEEVEAAVQEARKRMSEQESLVALFIKDVTTQNNILRVVRARFDKVMEEAASVQQEANGDSGGK
uniref:Conserved oligomeric Golgi complex subunit 3 n=1 Tax=Trypanosoma vivax (strain Y486) TaxID=1055687 RepID=G0U6Q8_TRYVY|nr:conserved hypothetical protein [Trypanosoma vivax Y486]